MSLYGNDLLEYLSEDYGIGNIMEGFNLAVDEINNNILSESYITEADDENKNGKIKEFIGKVKEWIKKIFAKIREVFKSFLNNISIKVTKKGEYPTVKFGVNKITAEINKYNKKFTINTQEDVEKAKEYFDKVFPDIDMNASENDRFDVFLENYVLIAKTEITSKEEAEKYKTMMTNNYKETSKVLDSLSKLENSFNTSLGMAEYNYDNGNLNESNKNTVKGVIDLNKSVIGKLMFITKSIISIRSQKEYSKVLKKAGIKEKDLNSEEDNNSQDNNKDNDEE